MKKIEKNERRRRGGKGERGESARRREGHACVRGGGEKEDEGETRIRRGRAGIYPRGVIVVRCMVIGRLAASAGREEELVYST